MSYHTLIVSNVSDVVRDIRHPDHPRSLDELSGHITGDVGTKENNWLCTRALHSFLVQLKSHRTWKEVDVNIQTGIDLVIGCRPKSQCCSRHWIKWSQLIHEISA